MCKKYIDLIMKINKISPSLKNLFLTNNFLDKLNLIKLFNEN